MSVARHQPAGLSDLAATVVDLIDRGLARQAEVTVASVALWLLDRVGAGRMAREDADDVFVAIDLALDDQREAALSREFRDLLTEGEHFHHFGEEWGVDPDALRELAFGVLRRDT